jgi:MFS family permease
MSRAGLDRSTLLVAGVATLGLVMAALDTTIVNVALDTLSSDLHAPLGTIQWVSTAYLLSLAAVIPLQHESTAALSSAGGTGGLLAPLSAAERARISAPVATAFAHTFMWAAVMALLAVAPAVALLLAERARRRVERPSAAKRHGGPRVPRSSAA